MFASLLPDGVLVARAADWMWNTPLSSAEEACIARAVPKRQREFRAGRHCAHQLLDGLGVPFAPLLPGTQRQPQWPAGIKGSITHTHQHCYVAITPQPHVLGVGIDVECHEPLDEDVRRLILTPKEIDMIRHWQPLLQGDAGKVIFSAKECIHKVYFPLNRHTLDFLDAEITLNVMDQSFLASIVHPEPQARFPITELHGKYQVTDELVYTAIVLQQECSQ